MQWLVAGPIGFLLAYLLYKDRLLYLSRRKFKQSTGSLPPPALPQFDRFLGLGSLRENLRCLRNGQLLDCFNRRFEAMGSTYSIRSAGHTLLITADPENIKAINSTQFDDFAVGPARIRAFSPLVKGSVFLANGAAWQHARANLRPSFARHQITNYRMFEPHLDHLVAAIPKDGSTVDLEPLFYRFTLDAATNLFFGQSLDTLAPTMSKQAEEFITAYQTVSRGIVTRMRMGFLVPFWRDAKFNESCKALHRYADEIVGKAIDYRNSIQGEKQGSEESSSERFIFLHELTKDVNDPVELRDHLLTTLLAGTDTISTLLVSTFHLLGNHQKVWEKLRSEILPLGSKAPEWEDLRNMKYLRFVLNEVLRVQTVVPLNDRVVTKDTTLPVGGGADGSARVFVKKHQIIGWNTYSMHRRKDIFGQDADDFKPERWETQTIPAWSFLPFNGGPRICPGQQLALTEVSYVIVRLLQEFKHVESRDPEPWKEELRLTHKNANGAKVAFSVA